MTINYPELFEFRDFRDFLIAYAKSQKSRYPHWSYGSWARRLGVGGTATITRIVRGDREPGPMLVEKLVEYFGFSTKEAEYFRALVHQSKIRHLSESQELRTCNSEDLSSRQQVDSNIAVKVTPLTHLNNRMLVRHCELMESGEVLAKIGQHLKRAAPSENDDALYELEFMVRRLSPLHQKRTSGITQRPLQRTGSTIFE